MQRYGFFVKPPNVSATFFEKSLFLLHFRAFCRGKLAENALRNSHRCHRFSQMLLLGKNLPQNTRISQNLLLRIFSHRFHSAQMLTSGGALVSARLCRLPEQEVHQPSNIDIPLTSCSFIWYVCVACCGGFHLRYGWVRTLTASEFRGFCGRYTHPNNLCRSVKSVGEYHSKKVLWVLWILWKEITVRRFCADLWNLWENITARRFCEFCGFCGKKSQ